MKHAALCVLGMCLCLGLAGCAESEGTVTGTVTFDGHPIPSGSITFVKSDGGSVRGGSVIRDGSFQTKLLPGNYKIEVTAQKAGVKKKQKGFDGKDEEIELTEDMIPEWYNHKTELSEDIKTGPNTLKLDLKSKK